MLDFWVKHSEYVRELNEQDNEQSNMFEGKLKSFKKLSLKRKTLFFVTEPSRQDKSPNTLETKFLKNLSKCFSRLEGPPTSKLRREPWKFLYSLATGASTHEQAAKPSRENFKNQNFGKFSKSFSWLGHWPASESRKPSM